MAATGAVKRQYRKLVATTLSTDFRKACEIVTSALPQAGDNEVVIKNRFVGVNATDINMSAGRYSPGKEPPLDVGLEGIGFAEEVGKNVPTSILGKAFGYIANGSFAEYIKLPYKMLLPLPDPKPEHVPLLISGLTAAISLDQFGKLQPGAVMVVTAAAGGTGHLAVQLGKQKGCHVIATCSTPAKAEFLKTTGADRVVILNEEKLSDVLKEEYKQGIDIAYESVGGNLFQACVDNLAPKGRIISLGYITHYQSSAGYDRKGQNSTLVPRLLLKSGTVSGFFLMNHYRDYKTYFKQIVEMQQANQIKPHVETESSDGKRFIGLESIYDAVEYLYTRESCGKIVVDLQNPTGAKL